MRNLNVKKFLSLVAVLELVNCALIGYLGYWREWYWAAVQARHLHDFWVLLGKFTIVVTLICAIYGVSQYLCNYLALEYRRRLTKKWFKKEKDRSYASGLYIEGYQQRIQEDCLTYPMIGISVGVSIFRNIIIFITFSYLIIHQIGALYLLLPCLYAILSTWAGYSVAKPLINLNYINQVLEAKFRQTLGRKDYAKTHRNNTNLFRATKRLSYFQSFYDQFSVIVPIIMLSYLYFSNGITFGVLMQGNAAIAEIITCLSIIINSYNDINRWLSAQRRLKELEVI
jgi:putative ATP-binding cassette transporter